MKVRRFKSIVALPGVFNADIEFIEYSTKKGVFYRKGYPNKERIGLNLEVHKHIFKTREIDKWYEPLAGIEFTKTDEYKMIHGDILKSIDFYDKEIKKTSTKLDNLQRRRRELMDIIRED